MFEVMQKLFLFFVVADLMVLYTLNIKMSIYKVIKNDKMSSCFAF